MNFAAAYCKIKVVTIKTKVKVGSEFSEKFDVAVGVYQGSVLSPLLFAIVVDVVRENVRKTSIKGFVHR